MKSGGVIVVMKSGLMALPEITVWAILGWELVIRRMSQLCIQGEHDTF